MFITLTCTLSPLCPDSISNFVIPSCSNITHFRHAHLISMNWQACELWYRHCARRVWYRHSCWWSSCKRRFQFWWCRHFSPVNLTELECAATPSLYFIVFCIFSTINVACIMPRFLRAWEKFWVLRFFLFLIVVVFVRRAFGRSMALHLKLKHEQGTCLYIGAHSNKCLRDESTGDRSAQKLVRRVISYVCAFKTWWTFENLSRISKIASGSGLRMILTVRCNRPKRYGNNQDRLVVIRRAVFFLTLGSPYSILPRSFVGLSGVYGCEWDLNVYRFTTANSRLLLWMWGRWSLKS